MEAVSSYARLNSLWPSSQSLHRTPWTKLLIYWWKAPGAPARTFQSHLNLHVIFLQALLDSIRFYVVMLWFVDLTYFPSLFLRIWIRYQKYIAKTVVMCRISEYLLSQQNFIQNAKSGEQQVCCSPILLVIVWQSDWIRCLSAISYGPYSPAESWSPRSRIALSD